MLTMQTALDEAVLDATYRRQVMSWPLDDGATFRAIMTSERVRSLWFEVDWQISDVAVEAALRHAVRSIQPKET